MDQSRDDIKSFEHVSRMDNYSSSINSRQIVKFKNIVKKEEKM